MAKVRRDKHELKTAIAQDSFGCMWTPVRSPPQALTASDNRYTRSIAASVDEFKIE